MAKASSARSFPVRALSGPDYDRWLAGVKTNGSTLDRAGYAKLTDRSVLAHSQEYGSVESGLFDFVLNQDKPGVRSADMKDHP